MNAVGPGLIIFLVVALAAALFYVQYAAQQKRRQAFARLASKFGLRYDIADPFDTAGLPFELFARGDRREVENVLSGQVGGMRVRLFDYDYVEEGSDAQGHRTSSTHRFSCAMGEVDAACPHLAIEREGVLSALARHLGIHDIEFESEEFNRRFKVHSDAKRFAFAVIDARMIQWLLESSGDCLFEISGSVSLCYVGGRISPEEYEGLLGVLNGFHAHVPEVVASLYPRAKEAHT